MRRKRSRKIDPDENYCRSSALYIRAMYLNGEKVIFHSAREAEKSGIAMIYQEFNMVPELNGG